LWLLTRAVKIKNPGSAQGCFLLRSKEMDHDYRLLITRQIGNW
jgi:hypothetical protein